MIDDDAFDIGQAHLSSGLEENMAIDDPPFDFDKNRF